MGERFISPSMIWKRVLCRYGEPFFFVGTLFRICFPESFFPELTPAKAVRAPRCVKRVTSPISAMSWGPSVGPTPFIFMTTGYSGSVEAVSSIFRRSVQHCSSLPDEYFGVIVLWEHCNEVKRILIDLLRFFCTEIIAFTFTLVLI